MAVYSGGEINLDHGGYITKEVRGQGFEPSEGPGQGYGKRQNTLSLYINLLFCLLY